VRPFIAAFPHITLFPLFLKEISMSHATWTVYWACLLLGLAVAWQSHAAGAEKSYTLTPDEHGMVLKTPDGRTVFRYMTKKPAETKLTANSVCCLYPVKTPAGEDVVDFAPSDHPHHRGVFLAWHAIGGKTPADFWGWGQFAPTKGRVIVNREAKLASADEKRAVLEVRNDWKADDVVLIEEATTITARQQQKAFVIDLVYRLTPKTDLTLRQTAFSGFCAKARKDGKGVYSNPQGEVKLAAPHHLKPETDWPAADWYDYSTALESGKTLGLAILDHSGNPPTTWHNLGAISMVNPCIVAPGPVELKQGQPLRLCYRLVVHDGPVPSDLLKTLTAEWRKSK
jgi:hypothetical protein